MDTRSSALLLEILVHQSNFSFADKIAKAMDDYGRALQKANTDLSTAFAKLNNEIVKHWNSMAQSETNLIAANRKDSLTLWTSIRDVYTKILGKSKS
jgi:hypothetical protein